MPAASVSRLHVVLLPRIVALIRDDRLAEGARLTEAGLAARLQVSRTPVRAALALLARRGVVRQTASGFVVADAGRAGAEAAAGDPGETALSLRMAQDRMSGSLPEVVSETDLMRRYAAGRATVQRTLTQLAGLGVVERKAGHGWRFCPAILDPAARAESYRWRMIIEPAALLEPSFRLDPAWTAATRAAHEQMMRAPWRETASAAFFEMNAAFHEGLAAGAGNRYLLLAVQQQNQMRRLSNYDWSSVRDPAVVRQRVQDNCREHLAILARAEAGDMAGAAALMRTHLAAASLLREADRGVPSLRTAAL